jgi:hypothetical protein
MQLLTSVGLATIAAAGLLLTSLCTVPQNVTSKEVTARDQAVGDPEKQSCPPTAADNCGGHQLTVKLGSMNSSHTMVSVVVDPAFMFLSQQACLQPEDSCAKADAGQSASAFAPAAAAQLISSGHGAASARVGSRRILACNELTAAAGDDEDVVDVWVLAGQSNCVGYNQEDGQPMPALAAPWPDKILAYNRQCEAELPVDVAR